MARKGNFFLELQNQEEWSKEKAASFHWDDVHDTEDSHYGGAKVPALNHSSFWVGGLTNGPLTFSRAFFPAAKNWFLMGG